MIRLGLFVDLKNLYYHVNKKWPGKRVNYAYLRTVAEDHFVNGELIRSMAFGTEIKNEATAFRTYLESCGYEVLYRRAKYLDCNGVYQRSSWDAGIATSIAVMAPHLDGIVLASSNEDFVPVLEYCHYQGLLTFVLACGVTSNLIHASSAHLEINDGILTDSDVEGTENEAEAIGT